MDDPFLEVFKARLDGVFGSTGCWEVSLPMVKELEPDNL